MISGLIRTKKRKLAELKKKWDDKRSFSIIKSNDPEFKNDQEDIDELNQQIKLEGVQKEDILDFALWKFSDTEPSWDSPWGSGRP